MFAVSDLNKNFGGSMDLAQKRHGSADLWDLGNKIINFDNLPQPHN